MDPIENIFELVEVELNLNKNSKVTELIGIPFRPVELVRRGVIEYGDFPRTPSPKRHAMDALEVK